MLVEVKSYRLLAIRLVLLCEVRKGCTFGGEGTGFVAALATTNGVDLQPEAGHAVHCFRAR